MNLIEVFRESGKIYLVFEQLNRTILEELEGRSDNSGIEPLEVGACWLSKVDYWVGQEDNLADFESVPVHTFAHNHSQRFQAREHAAIQERCAKDLRLRLCSVDWKYLGPAVHRLCVHKVVPRTRAISGRC